MKTALLGVGIAVIAVVVVLMFAFHLISLPTAARLPALPLEFNTSGQLFSSFSALSLTFSMSGTGVASPNPFATPTTISYRTVNNFNASGVELYNMSLSYSNASVSYKVFVPMFTNGTVNPAYLLEEALKNETTLAALQQTTEAEYFVHIFVGGEMIGGIIKVDSGIIPLLSNSTLYSQLDGVKMLETKYTLTAPYVNTSSNGVTLSSLEITVGRPASGGTELLLSMSITGSSTQGTVNLHLAVNSLSVR